MACSNIYVALVDLERACINISTINPYVSCPVLVITRTSIFFAHRGADLTIISIPGVPMSWSVEQLNKEMVKLCHSNPKDIAANSELLLNLIRRWLTYQEKKYNVMCNLNIPLYKGFMRLYDIIHITSSEIKCANSYLSVEAVLAAIESDLANEGS